MIWKRKLVSGVSALAVLAAVGACGSSKHAATTPTTPTTAAPSSSSSSPPTSASTGTQAAGAPIKVGFVCSCSGPFGGSLLSAQDMYKAWVNTVNAAGGINGHQVQLITKDDAGNPGTSVSDVQSLMSEHVVALVDNSIVDQTWGSIVKAANIPVVGNSVTESAFYLNSDFYPEGQTENSVSYAFVATGKAAGATTLGYLYCAEAAICQETAALIVSPGQQLGVPVSYRAAISATAPNYTAQCVAAQQQHIGGLLNGDVSQVFERVAADCSRQGYHPLYISNGESFIPSMLTSTGVKDNAWYESNNLPPFVNNPATQAMNAAADKYYPGLRNNANLWSGGTSSETWASGILLADAVKAGGLGPSDTPTAAEIVTGLESLKGDTLGGLSPPLTFVAGQPHPVNCWFTFRVQNGVPNMTNNSQVTCQNGA